MRLATRSIVSSSNVSKTAAAFLQAGACCLGIGGQLVDPEAIKQKNFDKIRDLAKQYSDIVKAFRAGK